MPNYRFSGYNDVRQKNETIEKQFPSFAHADAWSYMHGFSSGVVIKEVSKSSPPPDLNLRVVKRQSTNRSRGPRSRNYSFLSRFFTVKTVMYGAVGLLILFPKLREKILGF